MIDFDGGSWTAHFVPFADDAFGNLHGFDLRGPPGPELPIAFWDHEDPEDDGEPGDPQTFEDWLSDLLADALELVDLTAAMRRAWPEARQLVAFAVEGEGAYAAFDRGGAVRGLGLSRPAPEDFLDYLEDRLEHAAPGGPPPPADDDRELVWAERLLGHLRERGQLALGLADQRLDAEREVVIRPPPEAEVAHMPAEVVRARLLGAGLAPVADAAA